MDPRLKAQDFDPELRRIVNQSVVGHTTVTVAARLHYLTIEFGDPEEDPMLLWIPWTDIFERYGELMKKAGC